MDRYTAAEYKQREEAQAAANAARNAGLHARDEMMATAQLNAEIVAAGLDKPARKKRNADLVQDAIELHDKLGTILHSLSGKSQKFHDAYGAFGLALLNLLREVR